LDVDPNEPYQVQIEGISLNADVQIHNYRVGMIVEAINKPDWGPGKIVHVDAHLHVIFRDDEGKETREFSVESPYLRYAAIQSDPRLDNMPRVIEKNDSWQLPASRISLATAEKKFLHHFPQTFFDPAYIDKERAGKDKAHHAFNELLGIDELRSLLKTDDIPTIVERALSVKAPVSELLSRIENNAFHDAMCDSDAARRFFTALLHLLESPVVNAEVFEPYLDAVLSLPTKKSKATSWPLATLYPHIAQPDRHMFLKPEKTKSAAETLGFDLQYSPILNWETYAALLQMGEEYLKLLEKWDAKDFVDVQSFIFVAGGGYDD
jgi:hypothetical protein